MGLGRRPLNLWVRTLHMHPHLSFKSRFPVLSHGVRIRARRDLGAAGPKPLTSWMGTLMSAVVPHWCPLLCPCGDEHQCEGLHKDPAERGGTVPIWLKEGRLRLREPDLVLVSGRGRPPAHHIGMRAHGSEAVHRVAGPAPC